MSEDEVHYQILMAKMVAIDTHLTAIEAKIDALARPPVLTHDALATMDPNKPPEE